MFVKKRTLDRFALFCMSGALVLIPVMSGCSDQTMRPNSGVADSTFASVLAEIQFVRAREEIKDDADIAIEDSILSRYGLERSQYEETLGYFSRNPEEFRDVLESVVEILEDARVPPESSQR